MNHHPPVQFAKWAHGSPWEWFTLIIVYQVLEETGFNLAGKINPKDVIELSIREQKISLFIVPGVPEEFQFKTKTRKEISVRQLQSWCLFALISESGRKLSGSNSLIFLPGRRTRRHRENFTWSRRSLGEYSLACKSSHFITKFYRPLKAFIYERKSRGIRKKPKTPSPYHSPNVRIVFTRATRGLTIRRNLPRNQVHSHPPQTMVIPKLLHLSIRLPQSILVHISWSGGWMLRPNRWIRILRASCRL